MRVRIAMKGDGRNAIPRPTGTRDMSRYMQRIAVAWEPVEDWLNIAIYKRGRFEIRRIDVLIVLFGIICCLYYSYAYDSWLKGILIGGSVYILMVMIGLWFLPAALPLRWQKVTTTIPIAGANDDFQLNRELEAAPVQLNAAPGPIQRAELGNQGQRQDCPADLPLPPRSPPPPRFFPLPIAAADD